MAQDPYKTLGVTKAASAEEIRKAYRSLAKTYHPDLNPGDKEAEDKFKAVTAAYELLSDEEKRKAFDAGVIDANGQPRADQQFEWAFNEQGRTGRGGRRAPPPEFEDLHEIFGEFFQSQQRQRAGRSRGRGPEVRGADVTYTLDVDFQDAATGATRRVTMHDGRTLDITFPKGLRDGQTLRLKGQGLAGAFGGEPGDALVQVKVRAHAMFERDGDTIKIEVPISLKEAVLGGKIEVPTIHGTVSLTVPKRSNTGRTLRLKGKGINGADQLVSLRIVLPDAIDAELEEFLGRWKGADYNPRKS